MSRLEEVIESRDGLTYTISSKAVKLTPSEQIVWVLGDISETLAMIYDKMCEKSKELDNSLKEVVKDMFRAVMTPEEAELYESYIDSTKGKDEQNNR